MTLLLATAHLHGPVIDWAAFSPLVATSAGGVILLLLGLFRNRLIRERILPGATIMVLGATIGLAIWRFHHSATIISGALRIDDLSLELIMLFAAAGIAAVLLSVRGAVSREAGHGEYHALLVFSVFGMSAFVAATDLITLFLSIELLSIPLYILCASQTRSEASLEAGLKYLIIGSLGSATLLFGLALVYGATGSTSFTAIGSALSTGHLAGGVLGDPMVYTGLGLVIVGFAFKASIAPFHQWTPDVYEGAPTPITAFMATATKAAAIGVFLRFFDVAAIGAQDTWAPMLAAVAAITMIVGNVGALGQSSLKRMMGYSGVAQAGYMLSGVVVGTQLGIQASVMYLVAYLFMNMAAFACIVGREVQQPEFGDDISTLAGLGARDPWLAGPMTIGMLALAGIPGTVGFVAKFQLIHALVDGNYTWLGIVLVIGSMISLGYYLRVVATMWMSRFQPVEAAGPVGALAPMAGGSQEADAEAGLEPDGDAVPASEPPSPAFGSPMPPPAQAGPADAPGLPSAGLLATLVGVVSAAVVVFFGIIPSPLFDFAWHAGHAITGIF
jgi:NADH-quinone oxidoreductase subunit N